MKGKAWLDAAAQVYAKCVGISLSTSGSSGSTGGSSGGAVMNSKEFLKFQAEQLFAGHLLGEFSTLASVADILPNSSHGHHILLWSDYVAWCQT